MSNYNDLSLWLVSECDVSPATAATESDGINSVLVAATTEDAALKIADAYDRGEIEAGNLAWGGETIAVLTIRDDLGNYL